VNTQTSSAEQYRTAILTTANQLTILRIVFIPVFIILLTAGNTGLALATFVAAGITDVLDGVIARRFGQKTSIGTVLDPLADKLLMVTSLVILSLPQMGFPNVLPLWLTILLISRDVLMMLVALVMLASIYLVLKRTRIGLVIQAALSHPQTVEALGHNVPRVFMLVFGGGCALAGLAGVIGGVAFITEPSMAASVGPIVFVVVVFGGLGSLAGCFIASLIMGFVQTFAVVLEYSPADALAAVGIKVTSETPLAEVLTIPLPRIGALLPFVMLIVILLFRPRGLMGTRDT